MPMLVAEELNVDLSKINIDLLHQQKFTLTYIWWSNHWWFHFSERRLEKTQKAGASARMMLVAAADNWGVDASKCSAKMEWLEAWWKESYLR